MMIQVTHRISRIMIFFLICISMTACAGYPDDPKSPRAENDTYKVVEDGFLEVPVETGILSNDEAREGGNPILITVGEIETDGGGLAILSELGDFTYAPGPDFNGMDQLVYTIRNTKGKETTGTIYFDVEPVNDPPRPVDDTLDRPVSEPTPINVLSNDVEPDGDAIHILEVSVPDNGAAELNDGVIIYTPPPGHTGNARFSYTVADTTGEQGRAWVSLRVIDRYNSIEMNPDSMTVAEDTPGAMELSELLSNDHDLYEGALAVIELGEAENGMATLTPPTLTYAPNPDFSGTDTFTYTVQSEQGYTASSTVTVTITPENDPPTISPIEDQTVPAGSSSGAIAFTIEDPDNPFEELTVAAEITNADPPDLLTDEEITLGGRNGNRSIQITTRPVLTGTATITIVVSDREETSREAFELTVSPPPQSLVEFYQYFNTVNGDHYYTIDRNDENLAAFGYVFERVEGFVHTAQIPGTVPLIRYYNSAISDHFYTITRNDAGLGNYGYAFERVECYVYSSQEQGTVPLHRYYSPEATDHYYTTDWNELGQGGAGYNFEGIEGYVIESPY